MNKKFLCVVLALCFIISLMPAFTIGASAADETITTSATTNKLYKILSELSSAPNANTDYVIAETSTSTGFYNQSTGLVQVHLGATPDPTLSSYYSSRTNDITYDVNNAAQSAAFQSLFDSCGGTLAYNTAGCQYSCVGGRFKNFPVYLYSSAEYTLTSVVVTYDSSYYTVGTSVSKSMISSITGTFTNGSDTVTAPLDISGSGWTLAVYHTDASTGSTFTANTDKLQVSYGGTNALGNGPNLGYTVTYNANGGSGAPSRQIKISGTPLSLSATYPTKAGYGFLAWSVNPAATDINYTSYTYYTPAASFTTEADTTLYAVWGTQPGVSDTSAITFSGALVGGGTVSSGTDANFGTYPGSYITYEANHTNSATTTRLTNYSQDGYSKAPVFNLFMYYNGYKVSGAVLSAPIKVTIPFNKIVPGGQYWAVHDAGGTNLEFLPATVDYLNNTLTFAIDSFSPLFILYSGVYYSVAWLPSSAYTVTPYPEDNGNAVAEGGSYSFTVSVSEGYGGTPLVQANGSTLTAVGGVYTIASVTADQTITVSGLSTAAYSVTYNANGGSGAPSTQTKTYDSDLPLSTTVPTQSGYTFQGWGTSSSATIASYFPGEIYTANSALGLFAIWRTSGYNVAYFANGSGVTGLPSSPQTKDYDVAITIGAAPSRTGYDFMGWATSATGSASYQPGDVYEANSAINFYAVWRTSGYTVTYDANGGSGAPSSQTKVYGTDLQLSTTVPTRSGYAFKGWGTSSTATVAAYQPGGFYGAEAGLDLFAVWEKGTYTITYDANEGSNTPASQTKDYGDTAFKLTSSVPTRDGYDFVSWNTVRAGGGTSYLSGATYSADANLYLYAQWTAKTYTVTYNANGTGVTNMPSSTPIKTHGVVFTLSSMVPLRTGYTFKGWAVSNTSVIADYAAGADYTLNENLILYAVWEVNTYTVTFYPNNGDVHNPGTATDITVANMPSAQTVAYGGKAVAPTAPTTAYYVLEGWYTEAACTHKWDFNVNTMGTANVDLYAKWQANFFTVTFDVAAVPSTRVVSWSRGNIGATSNELYIIKGGSVADAVGSYSDPVCTTMDTIETSKPAYTFGGWLTASNSKWDFNSVVTSNLTLTANWVPNGYYIVTFDFNHGAAGGNSNFTVNVKGGEKILVPSSYSGYVAPTRTGYTLNGWFTDSTVGTPCNFDTKIVTAPLTVYAGWFTKGIEFQTATGAHKWSGAGIYKDYFQEELYTAFEDGVTKANASVDVTYAVLATGDALPSGLYLDAQTGVIYGAPTVTGSFSINIRATNSGVGATNGAKYADTTVAIVIVNRDVTIDLKGTYTNHKIYGQNDAAYYGTHIDIDITNGHVDGVQSGSSSAKTITITYTYTKYVNDTQTPNSYTDTFTASVSRAVGENVGQYKIYLLDSNVSVSGLSAGSTTNVKGFYDFTYPANLTSLNIVNGGVTVPAKYIYTINKRDIQIEAIRGGSYKVLSKVYGQDDEITARVMLKNDSVFSPAKDDTVTGDYGLTGWSVTDINGTVTSLSDSLTGNLYRAAGETVATYPLTVVYTDGSTYVYTLNTKTAANVINTTNYNFLSLSAGSLTITAKPITVETTYNSSVNHNPSKTYGTDDNIGFSVTTGSLVTRVVAGETDGRVLDVMDRLTAIDDVWTGSIFRGAGEDVGDYALMMKNGATEEYLYVITNADATKASRTSNYTVTYDTDSHLTITKKALTVQAVSGTATKVYGADDALVAQVKSTTPLVHGVTVTDTWGRQTLINDVFVASHFGRATGENIGDYEINLGTTGVNTASTYTNYNVTLETTTFTITQKALALSASFAVGSVPTNGVVSYDKFTGAGLVSRSVTDVNGNSTAIADVLTAGVYSTVPANQVTAGTYALGSSTLHEDTAAAVGSHTSNYTLSNVTVTIYTPSLGGGGSSGFTVTYDAGTNGTIASGSETETVASGYKPANVPVVTPTTGLVFKGWTLDGSAAVPGDTVITKNVTFVAVYGEHKCAVFTDIAGHWALDSICYVTENDMFEGTSATTFSPNATMTRAMFVTVLYRMAGSPAISGSNPFTEDVAADQWYTNSVVFAANNAIVKGTSETTYSPNDPVTREQMAVILYNYAVYRGYNVSATNDLSAFSDAGSVSSWALTQTKWAVAKGLLTGMTTTTLEPQGAASRAQVATILTRFVKTFGA